MKCSELLTTLGLGLAALCLPGIAYAQTEQDQGSPASSEAATTENAPAQSTSVEAVPAEIPTKPISDTLMPDPTAHWYSFGLGVGVSAAGSVTWKFYNKWTGEFRTIDEGWFGRGTYAGGADKLGHMYTDFVLGRGFYKIYRAHNYSKADAIKYAFAAGVTTRTIMEVADGFTTFEFSAGDLTFNLLGAASNALLLLDDDIAETFYLSWSYMPSNEVYSGYHDPFDFSTDYSGMVFGLNADTAGVRKLLGAHEKSAWDDTFFGFNYYTRNFRQPDDSKRERFVGASLGFTLDRFITPGHWSRPVLKYVKLPYTFAGLAYSIDRTNVEAKWGLNYLF
jgi:hypothetical protein